MVPLTIASLCGGLLYAWDPGAPFLFVFAVTLVALGIAVRYVHDPHQAEA